MKINLIMILVLAFTIGVLTSGCFLQDGDTVQVSAVVEPVFFVHVSDTHIGAAGGKGEELMTALFKDVLPEIKPLALVHTGDMANTGSVLLPWQNYSSIVNAAGAPQCVDIIGNHNARTSDTNDGRVYFNAYSRTGVNGGKLYGVTRLESAAGAVCMIRTDTASAPGNDATGNACGYFPETQQIEILNNPGLYGRPARTGASRSCLLAGNGIRRVQRKRRTMECPEKYHGKALGIIHRRRRPEGGVEHGHSPRSERRKDRRRYHFDHP